MEFLLNQITRNYILNFLKNKKKPLNKSKKTEEITEDDIETLEKELNDVCNNIKPKQQEENNFDDNDINDILGFIENNKKIKNLKSPENKF